jgi:hypothetical protein
MEPIFTLRQLVQSLGQFVLVVVTNLAVYDKFSDMSLDRMAQPIVQGLIVALGILGFARVGPAAPNVSVTVEPKKL